MRCAQRCRHCGTRRMWEVGSDGVYRPELTDGPHGIGHYPYRCGVSQREICEPETPGDVMTRQTSELMRRRIFGHGGKRRN